MRGRSTTGAIHLTRTHREIYTNRKKDLHIVFIDLEKAYDRLSREVSWTCLERKEVSFNYIQVIKDIYKRAMTRVRTEDVKGDKGDFPIDICYSKDHLEALFFLQLLWMNSRKTFRMRYTMLYVICR